ncbi:MAG: inovirus-type Gp2 protein [Methylophaga sp.]|nr:inovirus-type Gp2 protein [Methylophaga sp.]
MREIAPNITGGFDIAVLTYKSKDEALIGKASSLPETAKKERLFLLSKEEANNPPLNNKETPKKIKRTTNRKRVISDDTFLHNGVTYQINTAKSGLYVEILIRIIDQFEIAVLKWKRVLVLRFDLHTHKFTKDNHSQTAFRKRLFQKLKRVYGFKEIGFCWVREQERSKSQHYHWVLFLDGDLIRHSKRINQLIKDAWERPCGNYHVPTIKRPFYFADSSQVAISAIYRVSYLAKPRGKGYRAKQTKDYQCSRMKL